MELMYTILLIILMLIVVYYILGWLFQKSVSLSSLQSGTTSQIIDASHIPNSNNSNNYSFSTWFYVEDWNYRYGEPKTLLSRDNNLGLNNSIASLIYQMDSNTHPTQEVCPKIYLGARENDIHIELTTFASESEGSSNNPILHKSVVQNFPLQKWVNLIISIYGHTLDIYIDGKLVRSDLIANVAKPCSNAPVKITDEGGFKGWTSNFKYWSHALNPQEAYNIYSDGYGGSYLGNIFNKYRIKVAFLEDNKEEASFEI